MLTARTRVVAAALAVTACKSPDKPVAPPPDPSPEHLRAASGLGKFLSFLDGTAYELRTEILGEFPHDGWIVDAVREGDQELLQFVYYRRTAAGHERVRRVVMRPDGPDPPDDNEPAPLTDTQAAMARARDLALAQAFKGRCSARYEAFVLTAEPYHGRDGWAVYLLPQLERPHDELVYTGGQALVLVSSDGRTVEQTRPLSTGCHRLPLELDSLKAIVVSPDLLIDPLPLETHYYLSARFFLPVFVTVILGRHAWSIMPDGRTSRMTGSPKKPR